MAKYPSLDSGFSARHLSVGLVKPALVACETHFGTRAWRVTEEQRSSHGERGVCRRCFGLSTA